MLREPGHGNVAGGNGVEAVALGGEDALGAAGGTRGVKNPRHFVKAEVVRGFVDGHGGGEFLVGYGARGQGVPSTSTEGASHDDGHLTRRTGN